MRTRGPSRNRQSLFSFFNKSVHTCFHGVKGREHIENVYDYDIFFSDSVIFLLYGIICSIILKITNTKGGISHENCDNYRCLFRHGARGSLTAGGSLFGTSGSLADCPPDGPDAGAGTDVADPGAVFRHRSDGYIPAGDAGKRAGGAQAQRKTFGKCFRLW